MEIRKAHLLPELRHGHAAGTGPRIQHSCSFGLQKIAGVVKHIKRQILMILDLGPV